MHSMPQSRLTQATVVSAQPAAPRAVGIVAVAAAVLLSMVRLI